MTTSTAPIAGKSSDTHRSELSDACNIPGSFKMSGPVAISHHTAMTARTGTAAADPTDESMRPNAQSARTRHGSSSGTSEGSGGDVRRAATIAAVSIPKPMLPKTAGKIEKNDISSHRIWG